MLNIIFLFYQYRYLPGFINALTIFLIYCISIFCQDNIKIYLTEINSFLMLSYFTCDLIVNFYSENNIVYYLHHIITLLYIYLFYILYSTPLLNIYALLELSVIIEFSSIFFAIFLQVVEQKREFWIPNLTKIFIGLLFLFIFFIMRFVILFYYIFFYQKIMDKYILFLWLTPIHFLNLYWLYILVKGTIKEINTLKKNKNNYIK